MLRSMRYSTRWQHEVNTNVRARIREGWQINITHTQHTHTHTHTHTNQHPNNPRLRCDCSPGRWWDCTNMRIEIGTLVCWPLGVCPLHGAKLYQEVVLPSSVPYLRGQASRNDTCTCSRIEGTLTLRAPPLPTAATDIPPQRPAMGSHTAVVRPLLANVIFLPS